jgi:hypothetical protein
MAMEKVLDFPVPVPFFLSRSVDYRFAFGGGHCFG